MVVVVVVVVVVVGVVVVEVVIAAVHVVLTWNNIVRLDGVCAQTLFDCALELCPARHVSADVLGQLRMRQ